MDTSWGKVAEWYDQLLDKERTYQQAVILPNLLRIMDIKKGETVLDIACGQGFFAKAFYEQGANVIGVDIAAELLLLAKKKIKSDIEHAAEFYVSSADDLRHIKDKSVDKITIIMAIQNIDNVNGVFKECQRVLKDKGSLHIVMNHPCFRVPQQTAWEWDETRHTQYRQVNRYLSELKIKIAMHPGKDPGAMTISFHRPLQYYFKMLKKNNFAVIGLEEWISNKQSGKGPRQQAEDRARKEIPLFLTLTVGKFLSSSK
ncbi:MAG: methyltransferase domain-containing protein [bacterium]